VITHKVFDDFFNGRDTKDFYLGTHTELKRLEGWLWDAEDGWVVVCGSGSPFGGAFRIASNAGCCRQTGLGLCCVYHLLTSSIIITISVLLVD
jgi:hypothetical protein